VEILVFDKLRKRIRLAGKVLVTEQSLKDIRPEIPSITPEEVLEVKKFFPLEKFFIFGHARSGTTILARLIRIHPDVHCNWQAHFFTRPPLLQSLVEERKVGVWLSRENNRWNQGDDLSPVILRAAADFIMEREAQKLGKWIVGDKSPNSLLHEESVKLMYKVYPDARLIYIVRDGRDTVLSHRFQAFIDTPEQLSNEDMHIREAFAINSQLFLQGKRSVFTEKGIRHAAEVWVRNMEGTNRVGKELYGERYLSLRYEDLLEHPWEKMIEVWGFLGASRPSSDLQAEVMAEVHQNLDAEWQLKKASEIAIALQKGKHGSWRDMFTSRDRQVFNEVAGETLRAWGYED
jgi:hypothetical protein